jgi:hypothetical protein
MGLFTKPKDLFRVAPKYQKVFHALGLDAHTVFTDPRIVVWRSIRERQNGYLDVEFGDGKTRRLHVKRFVPANGVSPAQEELTGIRALELEHIPTTPVVAFGTLADRRSFIITEDLAGFRAADKALADGSMPFEMLLEPTADLAARLHSRGLHHRDLYLCHFFVRVEHDQVELRLIDAARVKRLPGFLTRRRWVVKDLAQFWYSTLNLPVTDDQRARWLARYAAERKLASVKGLSRAIARKVRAIARHDERLKGAQPNRNVSIPGG